MKEPMTSNAARPRQAEDRPRMTDTIGSVLHRQSPAGRQLREMTWMLGGLELKTWTTEREGMDTGRRPSRCQSLLALRDARLPPGSPMSMTAALVPVLLRPQATLHVRSRLPIL